MTEPRALREQMRWDEESLEYDRFQVSVFSDTYDEIIRLVCDDLGSTDSVLEVGCGSGIVTLGVSGAVQSIKGYDISEKMLEIAREKARDTAIDNVEFLQGDAYGLPYPDSSFDAILCPYVLDIVEQPDRVLKEARRLLRKGGVLISVTDCHQDKNPVSFLKAVYREVRRFLHGLLRKTGMRRHKQILPKDQELIRLTNDAGFRVISAIILDIDAPGEDNHYNLYLKATEF